MQRSHHASIAIVSILAVLSITSSLSADAENYITGWSSVHTHGAAGPLDIPLDPSADATQSTVEPRSGGIQEIRVDLVDDVQPADPLDPSSVTVIGVGHDAGGTPLSPISYIPTAINLLNGGFTLQILFALGQLPDETFYFIDISGVIHNLVGDTNCYVRSLVGDANANGSVTLADMLMIKTKVTTPSQPVSPDLDINVNGIITLADMLLSKSRVGRYVVSPGTGACCDPHGACTVTTEFQCALSSGTYGGEGTSCNPSPCPTPTGACCDGVGGCFETQFEDCVALGQTYEGDGTSCASSPCTGACCGGAGTCTQTTSADCETAGGEFHWESQQAAAAAPASTGPVVCPTARAPMACDWMAA